MRRDRRLSIALVLLLITFIAAAVQVWMTALYIDSLILGNWAWFSETFRVEAPASGAGQFCFDRCAPNLPFIAGWIGLGSLLAATITLAIVWWKPFRTNGQ
ncbi:hypothetical protein ASE91_14170 [Sphingomonas sp. Leaf62]|nr:hypothetical protein ASE91_14170 [Sphingomonas sp. Leaf62]